MAGIVVEDGTEVAGANSYASVVYADAYWLDRNNATWAAATGPAKIAALLEAAQFMDPSYKWLGNRVTQTQNMSWPRYVVLDLDQKQVLSTTVDDRVLQAQCELALEALSGRLDPTLDRGGMVTSEKVGSLQVTYSQGAPGRKRYPFVEVILRDLIMSSNSISGDAVRA